MKITVLSGSPKGEQSVTLQYIAYIQKHFPEHNYQIIPISSQIREIETNASKFDTIITDIKNSDLIIWAFPLYYFLVPGQYKRFIELVFERKAEAAFNGKYAAVLTTSIHFFDHTAHNYMNAVCEDLKMNFAGSYSPAMHDLLNKEKQKHLLFFAKNIFHSSQNQKTMLKNFIPLSQEKEPSALNFSLPVKKIQSDNKKIVILADYLENNDSLTQMIHYAEQSFFSKPEVFTIKELDIKGGCLGCVKCGYNYECSYQGKDGLIDFVNQTIKSADIILFAGHIKDRFLSSYWKVFLDRSFFNTHSPYLKNKQIAFLLTGKYYQTPNIKEVLQGYAEMHDANLLGILSDELTDADKLSSQMTVLLENLNAASQAGFEKPKSFLGIGGRKIFRDEIYGHLRFVFRADHKYYKKNKFYDFPQKEWKTRILNSIVLLLLKIPGFRKEFNRRTKAEMIKPFQKVLKTGK